MRTTSFLPYFRNPVQRRRYSKRRNVKELPSLMVLPIVPNATKKHRNWFASDLYSPCLADINVLDSLAAYAVSVSHTPGLMLKARGVGDAVLSRFIGPSALEQFNLPFESEALESHLSKGVDFCRSTFPWLFLTKQVPSLQTQPMSFATFRTLAAKESQMIRGIRRNNRGLAPCYEIRVFFLNMDLPNLYRLGRSIHPSEMRLAPVDALLDLLENEFFSFSNMLAAKHPEAEHPLVKGSRLKKDPFARASVDEVFLNGDRSQLKLWELSFKKEEDLLQLVLMIKSRLFNPSDDLMRSSESLESKISRKWI